MRHGFDIAGSGIAPLEPLYERVLISEFCVAPGLCHSQAAFPEVNEEFN
jgi:hypothetical protein